MEDKHEALMRDLGREVVRLIKFSLDAQGNSTPSTLHLRCNVPPGAVPWALETIAADSSRDHVALYGLTPTEMRDFAKQLREHGNVS